MFNATDVTNISTILAKAVSVIGVEMNDSLVKDSRRAYRALDGISKKDARHMPFDVALALTHGWLVASGHDTHAGKSLRVIRAGKVSAIKGHKHPRGHAVRKGLSYWMPRCINGGPDWCPTFTELKDIHDNDLLSTQNCSWSTLAPVKLYVLANGWPTDQVNAFVMPVGRPVRVGLKNVLGIEIPTPETLSGHLLAHQVQRHLATLAGVDVSTVNSGFWMLGE